MTIKTYIYALLFLLICMTLPFHQAHASVEQPEIYVNNEKVDLYAVVSSTGVTYVPFRPVFEKLDMTVEWNNEKKSVTATNGQTTIMLAANSYEAYINGKQVELISPPAYHPDDSTLYVNLRFVAEASGAQVTWITKDNDSRIYIKIPE